MTTTAMLDKEGLGKAREGFYAATTILPTGTVLNLDAGVLAYLSHDVVGLVERLRAQPVEGEYVLPRWKEERAEAATTLLALSARTEAAEARVNGWQPIETAPKDGTAVDLINARGDRFTNFRWDSDFPRGMWTDARYSSLHWMDRPCVSESAATNWMPLPPAPPAARSLSPIKEAGSNG